MFFYFKVSKNQLWLSGAYITCQKRLLNQEILKKQKAIKSLQPMLETIRNNLNSKMIYIDCIHVCTIFVVLNDKNIAKVKNTKVRSYAIYYLIA